MQKSTKGFPTVMHSWRDIGKLGYGSAGAADSPWARQGIFVLSSMGMKDAVNTGGPGIIPSRRPKVENVNQKTVHEYVDAGGVCLYCHMLQVGHDRLIARLSSAAGATSSTDKGNDCDDGGTRTAAVGVRVRRGSKH